MTRQIPYVADGVLHVLEPSGGPKIAVGSRSWITWLSDSATRSFSFRSPSGAYTARKERRSRGGEYWTAYRRHSGRLRKAYLGKAEDLTLDRLDEAAGVLASSDDDIPVNPSPDTTVHDAGSTPSDAVTTVGPAAVNNRARERPRQEASGDPLLLTKLSAPLPRPSLVSRPRLSERLGGGLECKLILVSAPAGFGKTTVLGAWTSDLTDHRPVAWLSLDSGDNDPARFWRYFVAAVDRLQPGSGETALALLDSPQAPPIETVLTTLLNELADLDADAVLVLDDYHLIESRAIHEALTFLVEHLPARMHLVISTRADPPLPLARLRVRGEMAEVRAADLRFAPEEAATFLEGVMGLKLSAEEIAELETRTEGWIAGLQMAALAMRDRADVPGFIEAFTGSNRYVLDYLAEEVLGRQPEELRGFLLDTSVLDRMCGPLCDAVTLRDDGQEVLVHLEHANLFVIPLDDERRWYRYHHLFAEVLRQHLRQTQAETVSELHRRAGVWFERQGLMSEAVRHALAAGRLEHAGDLIEGHGLPVILGGQVRTVLGWIDTLPDALVRSRCVLCVVYATALIFANQIDAAEVYLKHAEELVGHDTPEDLSRLVLGQVAQLRAIIARFLGDLTRCVKLARRALELLPETEMLFRSGARLNVARAYQLSGDVGPDNERLASEVVHQTRASGSLFAVVNSLTNLARLQRLQGRLRAAAATYRQIVRTVPGQQGLEGLVGGAAYYVGLGDIHREWHDLDTAERLLMQGMDLMRGPLTIDADVVMEAHLALALVYRARGQYADALSCLNALETLARQKGFPQPLIARAEAARAHLAIARGDILAAARWADASGLSVDDELEYRRHEEYLALARVLIAQGLDDPDGPYLDDAFRLLERCLMMAQRGARAGSEVEILALQGLELHGKQDIQGALHALEQALGLAQPEGYVRIFVDEGAPMAVLLREILKERDRGSRDPRRRALPVYARRVLAVLESSGATAATPMPSGEVPEQAQPLAEPLTKRELEVLGLIAEGLSNREIAARLFIATSTVKWHVNAVFRKLEADSRTRVVARARQTGLLSE